MFHVEQCLPVEITLRRANCSTWNRDSSRHLQALKSVPRETFLPQVVRVFHVEHQFGASHLSLRIGGVF